MIERLGDTLRSEHYEPKPGEVHWVVSLPGGIKVRRPHNAVKYVGWSLAGGFAKYQHQRKHYDAVLMAAGGEQWGSRKSSDDAGESGSGQATLPGSSDSTPSGTRSRSTSRKRGSS